MVGRSLVGELKKGRYVYYHCTGYRGKCGEPYTREEALEQHLASGLRELVIAPTILERLKGEVVESDRTQSAARAQVLRRDQAELERFQTRLEVLYDDRLDGRIDAATYDRKAEALQQQQEVIRRRMRNADAAMLAPAADAVNLMTHISEGARLFSEQGAAKRRDLLRVVLQDASWKGGELQMSFKTPFEELRLSNRATGNGSSHLHGNESIFDNWRRGGDSNPRYP
jgi:site-specific DNA recombinase